jgi:hypothetical protein
MKTLLAGLYVLFAALLGLTFYVAVRSNDGLVEEDYYRKANGYLSLKETEENLGLTIRVPGRVETGRSRLSAEIATANGPLEGARATLRAMRLSGPGQDRTFPLREEAAGTYAAEIEIPSGGRWMLLLAVEGGGVRTERRWIATVGVRGAHAPEPGAARPGPAGTVSRPGGHRPVPQREAAVDGNGDPPGGESRGVSF